MSHLRFENVSFAFGQKAVLNNASFMLHPGEFMALFGANGEGKSTLLRLCNGLLKPSSGRVTVCEQDTQAVKTSRIARDVGFLFQNPDRQICQRTVREEILFGLEQTRLNTDADCKAEFTRKCDEILDEFGLNGEDDPFTLSRGRRQYVAIASLLVCEPKVLLLDEPTVWLDQRQIESFLRAVKKRQAKNRCAVLMITHDLPLAHATACKTMTLKERALVC
jgi:energy-coupling factor transport system ATP-binding protein